MKQHECHTLEPLIEALADGELPEAERAQLEQALASCESCRARLAAVTEMGDLLRTHIQSVVEQVDFDPLWSALNAEISKPANALDPLRLQAFADGELSGREMIEVADELARSPLAHKQLEALAEMGELVRTSIDSVAQKADYDALWHRLDQAVGPEIEAKGGLKIAPSPARQPGIGWWERMLSAIGGYRAVVMSAVTAAIVVLILVPILNRGGDSERDGTNQPTMTQDVNPPQPYPQQLEIRVVHVNEVVSNPGHQVTVDSYDGYAPVIYIRSEEDRNEEPYVPREPNHGIFDDPI